SVRDQSGISNSAENPVHESRFGFIFRELLFGRAFFNYLSQAPGRSFPFALTVLALGGYISFQTNLEPILLFYLKPTPGIGQIWVICLLSRAISTAKGLRIEQTALVSLAVMYMNITAVILALQVGLF